MLNHSHIQNDIMLHYFANFLLLIWTKWSSKTEILLLQHMHTQYLSISQLWVYGALPESYRATVLPVLEDNY